MSDLWTPREAIRLYCGVGEDDWNGELVEVGPLACISPVYGKSLRTKRVNVVCLSSRVRAVIQDSGAFCDGPGQRLSFEFPRRRLLRQSENPTALLLGQARLASRSLPHPQTIDPFHIEKAYSQDLRQRVLKAIDTGHSQAEVAKIFTVSVATIKRYLKQRRETGHVEPKAIPGRPARKGVVLQAHLLAQLEAHPDARREEHCQAE